MPPTICWRISSAFSILRVNPLPPKVSVSVVPNILFWGYPVSLALSIHIVSKDHPIRVIVVGAHHHDITPSHSRSGSDLRFNQDNVQMTVEDLILVIKLVKSCPHVSPNAVVDLVAQLRLFFLQKRWFLIKRLPSSPEETLTWRRPALRRTETDVLMWY